MDLTLYLRKDRIDEKGQMPIHGRICWGGEKLRFSTGEWAKPADWDEDWQLLNPKAPQSTKINRKLGAITSAINALFDNAFARPTVDQVRLVIDQIKEEVLGIKKVKSTQPNSVETAKHYVPLMDFFEQYISDRRGDRSPEWKRAVRAVGVHLRAFRPNLDWPDLKLNILNQFKAYLQEEEEASDNTIASYISLIRGMCDYAERLEVGIPLSRSWKWVEIKPAEVVRPVLTYADLNKLKTATLDNKNFRDKNVLERIRWYFLLACYTGLRRVDLPQLIDPRISTIGDAHCLIVLQQKTGRQVPIPLTAEAYELIKNPIDKKQLPVGRDYNEYIKTIGEQAGLDRLVTCGSFYRGELMTDRMPLHQTLSSHMARRTFASLLTDANLNTFVLQQIMGHQNITSTGRYTTVSDVTIVHQTLLAWQQAQKAA